MSKSLDFQVRVYVLALAALAAISTWYLHDLRAALIVLLGIPLVVEVVSFIERVVRNRGRG